MITIEEMARAEGRAEGAQAQRVRSREEIDAAYRRGFLDGGEGKFIVLLAGVACGAMGAVFFAVLMF